MHPPSLGVKVAVQRQRPLVPNRIRVVCILIQGRQMGTKWSTLAAIWLTLGAIRLDSGCHLATKNH